MKETYEYVISIDNKPKYDHNLSHAKAQSPNIYFNYYN